MKIYNLDGSFALDFTCNYHLRSNLIFSRFSSLERQIHLHNHCNFVVGTSEFDIMSTEFMLSPLPKFNSYFHLFQVVYRINRSDYSKVSRVRERVQALLYLSSEPVFMTFTLADAALGKYSYSYIVKTLHNFLRSNFDYAICNEDYGAKNGRLHFHALVSSRADCSFWINKFGAVNSKPIVLGNSTAIAKYIAKLTNHAVKATTKRKNIYYTPSFSNPYIKLYKKYFYKGFVLPEPADKFGTISNL